MKCRRAVRQSELLPRHIGRKLGQSCERRHISGQLLAHFLFGAVTDLATKKGLGVQGPHHQLDVQLQIHNQFTHLGRLKRVCRHQRFVRVSRFDVIRTHQGFREIAVWRFNEWHLAHGRARHQFGMVVTRPNQLLFKGHAFFKQLQLDFVVVVAGCKTAKLECHGVPLK